MTDMYELGWDDGYKAAFKILSQRPEIIPVEKIIALLDAQAKLRSLENDEEGILLATKIFLEKQMTELNEFNKS